mmetsp:Transcript_13851/g.21819  ORF Transcript_13851/g.21819 Transcript_13851/m.21819 type:complete len:181 (-) Transcript_13851:130-672(-)
MSYVPMPPQNILLLLIRRKDFLSKIEAYLYLYLKSPIIFGTYVGNAQEDVTSPHRTRRRIVSESIETACPVCVSHPRRYRYDLQRYQKKENLTACKNSYISPAPFSLSLSLSLFRSYPPVKKRESRACTHQRANPKKAPAPNPTVPALSLSIRAFALLETSIDDNCARISRRIASAVRSA